MEIATYSQVQELVRQLPAKKLRIAYDFLFDLVNKKKEETLSPQLEFMQRPIHERHQLLTEQAEKMVAHYRRTAVERQEWQAGDFIDEQY